MSISAGPELNAEAINLGASTAVFQNGLAGAPRYRKAVTVWILIAAGMEKKIKGMINFVLYGFPAYVLERA
ncbi:hypothetical protein BMS3Abin06_02443 [bacterium BMS3Abin06]|nr:hypothetical protein BMS3Abin06_02443 [bacterium BMS3Abin06]